MRRVVVLILLIGGLVGLPASTAAADSEMLIGEFQTGGNNGVFPAPAEVAARTFCIGYGDPDFNQLPPLTGPAVGCIDSLTNNQTGAFDYDAANTPDWSAFSALITNGVDESVLWACAVSLDANNSWTVPAGCGGKTEFGWLGGSDLAGFTLTRVRLIVEENTFSSTVGGQAEASYSARWQFYGMLPDADGDGVPDTEDQCPGTDLAADTAPTDLKKNRMWSDADGVFYFGDGTPAGITVEDTGGCSASQVIAAAGLGLGHERFGISSSAMDAYLGG
jgi:hypothetical protein